MISNPEKDISKEVIDVLHELKVMDHPYTKVHFRRIARTLEVLLGLNPTGRLLEVGTNEIIPIALQKLVPDLRVEVTHFDHSYPVEHRMTVNFSDQSRKVNAYSVDIETEPIPCSSDKFDFILCGEVIEHLEVDPMYMLHSFNRVLKTGGILLLTTPNINSSKNLWKMLRNKDPYFYLNYQKGAFLYRHNYEYSMSTLKEVLVCSGFKGKMWSEYSFEDPVFEDIDKLSNIGMIISNHGDNIFSISTKNGPVINRYPSVLYA